MAGPPQLPLLSALASCSWPSTPDELASLQSNIHIHLATLLTPTNPPVSPHYLQTSPSTLFRSPPEASPSPPTLHLSFHPPNITTSTTWTRLRIVSTAKNTEVYHADEYCGTAEVVDAVDVNVGGEEWMAYIHELIVDGSRGCVEGCDIKVVLCRVSGRERSERLCCTAVSEARASGASHIAPKGQYSPHQTFLRDRGKSGSLIIVMFGSSSYSQKSRRRGYDYGASTWPVSTIPDCMNRHP
ncbi:uncharacterized protein EV422DRAFT_324608 [Fimicolochytrium jonesii]|uniref:uncharacterized protein n=1 Tax=Fimicolochytrium jonesii TaxID=1396493 RepID=UPI0022FDEDB1|nr:uncharacterized protein EV422DRAFT_324608 [Fimicolochytrium jonesii]KAI8824543.1 hypothetical protein EV422DRAFT_324608 [Fimicolochytrium jonesii]